MLDFTSLLVAIGFSTVFLAAVLIGAWKTFGGSGFLLTSATGALLIAGGVGFSALHIAHPAPLPLAVAFTLMLAGLATLYGGAAQFRLGTTQASRIGLATLLALALTLPPLLIGYPGIVFLVGYPASAILVFMTAREFWKARDDAPVMMAALALGYLLVGLSFALRAVMVLIGGRWTMISQPSNWAEDLSLILVIGVIPAIGAMMIALSQIRIVQVHRRAALTDPLTGLMNRRALFEVHEGKLSTPVTAALFDIDAFKAVNDTFGHAAGDRVIVLFARTLRESFPEGTLIARLGGEEFAVILGDIPMEAAIDHAERARTRFRARVGDEEQMTCTVSAGLAATRPRTMSIDHILAEADHALYEAKRAGRDRIVVASPAR